MRTSKGLSLRQEHILGYIKEFIQKRGYSPSIRDIQTSLQISSTSVVAYNLKALQEKGKLCREGKISRGIRLAEMANGQQANSTEREVQVVGELQAGQPLPAPNEANPSKETIKIPSNITDNQLDKVFALRVRGHSMVDALVDDGDIVLLRYQETAEDGQLVAAFMVEENTLTLKKFYHEDNQIRLQPANSTLKPTYTTQEKVHIQGQVVGIIRSLDS